MARKLPAKDVVIIGLGLDRLDHGLRAGRMPVSMWSRSSAGPGAIRPPTIRRATPRTSCATVFATSCSCGRSRPPSRSATRWTRRRCRSVPGALSCRPTASAAAACTGMPRPGDSCRPTSCLRTHLTERYGAGFLPDDMTIQDWGVTYDELEPHYDRFEYLCGTSRTGRQPQGPDHRRRQSVRGTALAALSESAAAAAVRRDAVCQGGARTRLQAVSAAVRQHVARLPESARRAARSLHLSAASANGSAAATIPRRRRRPRSCLRSAQAELLGARQQRSHAHQSRRLGQARDRRHLCRYRRQRMGAAGRSRDPVGLYDLQRAASAAVRHRQALRSRRQFRRDRPQLHPSDDLRRRQLLRSRQVRLQSLHRLRRDRDVHR